MSEKFALKSHRHKGILEDLEELGRRISGMETRLSSIQQHVTTVSVFSADSDVYVGGPPGDKWHRIVCTYEGRTCLGSPRPHFQSDWQITEKGFSLVGFHNEKWVGWNGQYEAGMRYDEVVGQWPKQFKLHVNALYEHIKKEFGLWFPCHLYNDFTGDMYRP